MKSLTADQREARDRSDLAEALAVLKHSSDAEELLKDYCTEKLKFKKRFEFQFASFDLVCGPDTPPILSGGSALVLHCVHQKQPLLHYALKVPRHSGYDSIENLSGLSEKTRQTMLEFVNHAPLSHQNIARIFAPHTLNYPGGISFTAVLMEWIDGATTLSRYIAKTSLTWRQFVTLLVATFDALGYIHSREIFHWDIKSDNILIDGQGNPKVTDLGNARRKNESLDTFAYSTVWNIPPTLPLPESPTSSTATSRRVPIRLPNKSWDSPWIDLWMLAREINRFIAADQAVLGLDDGDPKFPLLGEYERTRKKLLARTFPQIDNDAQYALSYLRLVVQRLLRPKKPSETPYYANAESVSADLAKLLHELGAATGIAELQSVPQHVLRLPSTGNVPLTPWVRAFLSGPPARRLARHLQLGVVCHVYPGACHSRLEHVCGVLVRTAQYVHALYSDRTDPFWRISMEETDIRALLTAALLHDIGHVAIGHALEEMRGLFRDRLHEDYAFELAKGYRMDNSSLTGDASADREFLTGWIKDAFALSDQDLHVFLRRVASILRPQPTGVIAQPACDGRLARDESEAFKLSILHSILDSAIDADKLDYLIRDACHCGVDYPNGVDLDRFFQSLTCITPKTEHTYNQPAPAHGACVAVTEKGLLPAESILVARYQMFSSVYWQHTVRALDAILQFCVESYAAAGINSKKQNNNQCEVEQGIVGRIETLLSAFRQRNDSEALEWLQAQIKDDKVIRAKEKTLLADMCDALLSDRKKLYRTFFELQYEDVRYGDDSQRAQSIAEKFQHIADEISQLKTRQEYLKKMKDNRIDFAKLVSANLKNSLSKNGVKPSRKTLRAIELEHGELLLDIPPSYKDQIAGIYVLVNGVPKPIQHLSPVAHAVAESFRLWVRRVRVYISSEARDRLIAAGVSSEEIAEACDEAAFRFGPQQPLSPVN